MSDLGVPPLNYLQFMIDEATDALSADTTTSRELREELSSLGIVTDS